MHKDDATWLNVAYVCFFVLASYAGFQMIETIGIQAGWAERFDTWFPMANTVGSIVVGVIAIFIVRHKKDRHEYYLAAIAELRKVTWPSWPDTKRMTIIVCVVVGVFAVILAIFDVVWARALKLLLA